MGVNSPASGGVPATRKTGAADPARRRAIANVIAEVALRRARGEHLPDAMVLSAHQELLPELREELAALRGIHRTFLAAQKAAPAIRPGTADVLAAPLPGEAGVVTQTPISIQGYTVIEEASSGGQGAVFRGRHEATGKAVAIKVIWGGPLTGSRHRARFEREAEIMAKLDHPHIVPILDRGRTADGSLFLVMPFIEGCALDEYVDGLRSAPDREVAKVLRLFVLVCRAVAEAHKKGIVHRDLKPTNVRVDHRGEPHVLDFGLARALDESQIEYAESITVTGQIVGSLPWASPEQVSSGARPVDVRTDVYALGVMLYQALCGQSPYLTTGSVQEVLHNIISVEPTPPARATGPFSRQIRTGLSAIVMRALEKLPERRYATAAELADDLERYLNRRRLDPQTLPKSSGPWRRLMRVALMLAIPSGVAGILLWQHERPGGPPSVALPQVTNSVGMRLARVPAGMFTMGSQRGQPGRGEGEALHRVSIDRPYLIGVTEVTQAQYRQIMGSLPEGQSAEGDDLPVHNVSYTDAVAFCDALSQREGIRYRLPTEPEWEYACRVNVSPIPFAWPGDLDKLGWYEGNSEGRVHAVGTRQPNVWGIHDMHGNVQEWCLYPYREVPAENAAQGEVHPMERPTYVLRGGGYRQVAGRCRAAARYPRSADYAAEDVGLRVVCDEAP